MSPASQKTRTGATLAIVSLALFMVVLDNLVVTVALPAIREDLGATLQSLEWTINAYTLAFAVMLIPGAALGDRFGRRRLFLIGLSLFTAVERRRGAGADHRRARRRPRPAGRRRRDRRPADPHPAGRRLPGEPPRRRAGHLVGHQRHRRRARADRRRRRRRRHLMALDLLDQRPHRPRPDPRRRARAAREPRPVAHARPARLRPGLGRPLRARLRPRPRAGRGLDDAADRRRRWPSAPSSWRPSSPGSCAPRSRWSRWASSASAPSRSPTPCRSSCTSGPSARSSCSPRCCSTCWATRRSRPACGCCCGPGRRWSSRRSPASSPSASARAASWPPGWRCRPARWRGSPPPPARR